MNAPPRPAAFWAAVSAAALLAAWLLGSSLTPFLGGAAVAYMLRPASRMLQRLGLSKEAAAGTLIGGFFAALVLSVALVVPFLWSQAHDLVSSLPSMGARASVALHGKWDAMRDHIDPDTVAKAQAATASYFQDAAAAAGALLRRVAMSGFAIVDIASFLVLAPLVGYYLLCEWDAVLGWFDSNTPRAWAPAVRRHAREVDRVLAAWLRWEAMVCVLLSAYYSAALAFSGVRFGLLIGLATGMFAFVPYVGFLCGLCAALVACAFTFPTWHGWAAVALAYAVGNVLDSWLLTPKLVGRKVGLHDVWVIFALMAGAHLFGMAGIALAVPGAAVTGVFSRSALARYRASAYYHGGTGGTAAAP